VRTGTADRAGRIEFLDGIRGVAASLVVLQHLLATVFPAYRHWTAGHLDLGRLAVVAFFLVSGYVIPLSLEGQGIAAFATRRFFRLYPAYWVALALYALLHAREVPGGLGVVLNVAMVQGMVGVASLLPPAWTLSIELVFYLQSAVARARRLLDRSVYAGFGWLVLYLALCAAERLTGRDLPRTLPLLLFAASLGHAWYLRDSRGSRLWLPLLAAGAVLAPVGAYLGVDPTGEWRPFPYATSFLAGIGLFAAFYALRRRHIGRVLLFLGAISYAVYLFHPIVMDLVHKLPHLGTGLPSVPANLLAVAVVGAAVHWALERPSIRIGRSWTARRAVTVPARA
jgi:peptidoglycan/LPS O-acetylase OafA/YrhL